MLDRFKVPKEESRRGRSVGYAFLQDFGLGREPKADFRRRASRAGLGLTRIS